MKIFTPVALFAFLEFPYVLLLMSKVMCTIKLDILKKIIMLLGKSSEIRTNICKKTKIITYRFTHNEEKHGLSKPHLELL